MYDKMPVVSTVSTASPPAWATAQAPEPTLTANSRYQQNFTKTDLPCLALQFDDGPLERDQARLHPDDVEIAAMSFTGFDELA